ncbi:hypothetical protein TSUD_17570 [Trifolium subterraneum]|uniref:NADP-dependent oxidoreductase domain-containing protein n=1 Tax=Trifolium subterraneum TaxID=3900 RepID=A0A2Z6LYY7_TRISU|nr:hypothetical protein TSUD_17570 [Trifolium subterraneum]
MAVRCSFFSPSSSDVASLSHSLSLSLPTTKIRTTLLRRRRTGSSFKPLVCAAINNPLQYRKLGDSDLNISEITLGTMTFGEQNTEKESHDILNYAFGNGINALDTAEAYPIPMKKETQGKTDLYIASWLKSQSRDKIILATKVCGYSERAGYLRDNADILRVDTANIKESVEKSLKRLGTDYIDLLQIHWPDRYVPLFGEYSYDSSKWRPSVPFVEQLQAFQELIKEGKVRYIGVSNETSYGVMEFVHTAKVEGLPKIVSIQNSYSLLLILWKFAIQRIATSACYPILRLEATIKYLELAEKHGLTPVQLALGFARDRPFMTSSIIGATSVEQLKEDIDAFISTERPLPAEVLADIEAIFKRYKDPTIL